MRIEEPDQESFKVFTDTPSIRRRFVGCCAIIIIIIFVIALLVGYTSWFGPFIP